MTILSMASLGANHVLNALAEELYIITGIDKTKPVAFYAVFNENCNVKCRYCNYWRQDSYKEMSIEDWKKSLLSIKDFVGSFFISFSGGEPFLKHGFIDLLAWCHAHGISAGVTTNGSALTPRNAAKIVAAKPFNVNISVDGPSSEIHDHLRGAPGLFEKLSAGIENLIIERDRQNIHFPIIVKPTITSKNFRYLPELVEWAEKIGATSVSPQPVERWTPETFNELWIEGPDLIEFEEVIETLIVMVGKGAPILTPTSVMRLMPDHFREKKAPEAIKPCRVGTRNFFIRADGEVELCHLGFDSIGNLRTQSAKEIWQGSRARDVRAETYRCEKLCLLTCLSQKTLSAKANMALRLLEKPEKAIT